MQVHIVFTKFGSSSQLGNFGPGDRMRCSAEHARHLVDDVRCARYAQAEPPQAPADHQTTQGGRRPRARKEA